MFCGQNLQTFQVNLVPLVKLKVFLGKSSADDAD